jgi:hypothetical protein
LTWFRREKTSRGWSFWSITRTSLLSYNCFFFPLVEVELVELVGGDKEGGGEEEVVEEEVVEEEGAKVEEERPFFSFSA